MHMLLFCDLLKDERILRGKFGASHYLRMTFSLKSAFWQTNMPITVEEKHILTDKSYSSITLFLAIPN